MLKKKARSDWWPSACCVPRSHSSKESYSDGHIVTAGFKNKTLSVDLFNGSEEYFGPASTRPSLQHEAECYLKGGINQKIHNKSLILRGCCKNRTYSILLGVKCLYGWIDSFDSPWRANGITRCSVGYCNFLIPWSQQLARNCCLNRTACNTLHRTKQKTNEKRLSGLSEVRQPSLYISF